MAYGRRRYNPAADERRAREEKQRARIERDKAKLYRLLRQFRKVALRGDAAQDAWKEPQRRSFTTAILSDGTHVTTTIRGSGHHFFLQEAGHMGWSFYRLIPKHHVLRQDEASTYDRDRTRRRRRR